MSLSFDDFELDLDRFELRRDGVSVALEPQAFELLTYLVANRERVVLKGELFDAVWDSQFVSDSALTTRIKEVRHALGDDGRTQRYIRTVRGHGYHFVAAATDTAGLASTESTTAEQPPAPAPATTAAPVLLPTDSFIGRVAELSRLQAATEDAIGGSGGVTVLAGEAGIGKTRLTQELEGYAAGRGARVLWGRVRQASGAPPYHPWIQVATHYGREAEIGALDLGPYAGELTRLFPNLGAAVPDLKPAIVHAGASAQFRLFEAFVDFLRAASDQQPLLVVLEDLHWADEPTLALLQHLGPELSRMRLRVVATYRDTDIDDTHPLMQALAQLNREAGFSRIHLGGLSAAEVGEYVDRYTALALDRPLVQSVHERTEGNPFFVGQLVELIGSEGEPAVGLPSGVREALTARLERLSEPAHAALRIAAVCGRTFDLATLEAVIDGERGAALDLIEEALAAHVVEDFDEAGRYRFVHALMQETLLDQLSSARRAQAHGAIAEALETAYGDRAGLEAARLAEHFAESAQLNAAHAGPTVAYSQLAASQAVAQTAWSDAIVHYERCLAVAAAAPDVDLDTATVRLELGRCQLYEHLPRPAWRNLLTAMEEFRARGEWAAAAEALLVASDILAPSDRLHPLLTSVIEGGGEEFDDAVRAELHLRRALVRARLLESPERWQRDLDVAAAYIEAQDEPLLKGKLARVRAEVLSGPREEGRRDLYEEAADHLKRAGDAESASNAMWLGINEAKRNGDLRGIDDALDDFVEYVRKHRLRRWVHMAQYLKTRIALLRGNSAAARALLETDMPSTSHLSAVAGAALAEFESWPPADPESLLSNPRLAGGDVFQTTVALSSRLRLHVLLGDRAAALEDEQEIWERVTADDLSPATPGLFLIAGDIAAELADESFVEWCGAWLDANPTTRVGDTGSSANVRGRIALRLGDLDGARTHLEAGLARASDEGWPVDIGRAHQALAEVASRLGDVDGAAQHRQAAVAQFEACGAQVFLQQLEATET